MCPVDVPSDVRLSQGPCASHQSDLLPLLQGIAALIESQQALTKAILSLARSQEQMARAMSEDQDIDTGPMSTKR